MPSEERAAPTRVDTHWRRIAPGSREAQMLGLLGDTLGVQLTPRSLVLPDGSRIETEGMDDAGTIVVQLIGNQGSYKPAFRNKVMADALKLLWLRGRIQSVQHAVLVLSEPVLKALGGWVGTAIQELGVEIYVFDGTAVAPFAQHR